MDVKSAAAMGTGQARKQPLAAPTHSMSQLPPVPRNAPTPQVASHPFRLTNAHMLNSGSVPAVGAGGSISIGAGSGIGIGSSGSGSGGGYSFFSSALSPSVIGSGSAPSQALPHTQPLAPPPHPQQPQQHAVLSPALQQILQQQSSLSPAQQLILQQALMQAGVAGSLPPHLRLRPQLPPTVGTASAMQQPLMPVPQPPAITSAGGAVGGGTASAVSLASSQPVTSPQSSYAQRFF